MILDRIDQWIDKFLQASACIWDLSAVQEVIEQKNAPSATQTQTE